VLLMLLSVHLATSALQRPTLVRIPRHTGRLVLPDQSETLSDLGLQISLPTQGPPDSSIQRRFHDPPGDSLFG